MTNKTTGALYNVVAYLGDKRDHVVSSWPRKAARRQADFANGIGGRYSYRIEAAND